MNNKAKILIVEDEEAIRSGLVDVFIYHGYEVGTAEHGNDGLKQACSGQFDLVLLDVMLPGMNGFDILKQLREQDREQAVIMLTAKGTDEDIIEGLSLGADDYVAKPFSITQLVLRVEAVLRRTRPSEDNTTIIELDDTLKLDTQNLSADINQQTIAFTRREMDILQYLHQHHDRPVPRDELLTRVWGYAKDLDLETRTVDIHIAKLRRKIEPVQASPQYLVTVRGAGYKLLSK
jgi:two-component system response regulator RegX3